MSTPSAKIVTKPFSRSTLVVLGLGCAVAFGSAFVGARTSSGSPPPMSDDGGGETGTAHEVSSQRSRPTTAARPAASDLLQPMPAYPILQPQDLGVPIPPPDGTTPARHAPHVSTKAIEEYMARAPRDGRAALEVGRRFEEITAARQLVADREIECRGSVCRITLRFASRSEVARIAGVRPVDGSEFTYKLVNEEDNAATLLLYRTSPGVTFDALLNEPANETAGQVASKTADRSRER